MKGLIKTGDQISLIHNCVESISLFNNANPFETVILVCFYYVCFILSGSINKSQENLITFNCEVKKEYFFWKYINRTKTFKLVTINPWNVIHIHTQYINIMHRTWKYIYGVGVLARMKAGNSRRFLTSLILQNCDTFTYWPCLPHYLMTDGHGQSLQLGQVEK